MARSTGATQAGPSAGKKRKAGEDSQQAAGATTSPSKSVLKESKLSSSLNYNQEVDFPRGGAPPAATAAVSKKTQVAPSEDKGLFDDGLQSSKTAEKRKKPAAAPSTANADGEVKASKKRKVVKAKGGAGTTAGSNAPTASTSASAPTDTFRVEHLSYKRLLPGPTNVLVQVVEILPLELIVSLPNQLMGHVPITNISKTFTKRLEDDLDEEEEEEEEENSDEEDEDDDEASATKSSKIPALNEMFAVGQYLRAHVVKVLPAKSAATSLSSHAKRCNEDYKASRRCELSLEPDLLNAAVNKADLKSGELSLQAFVKSVEDNGYILDFGLPTSGTGQDLALTSFVTFDEEKKVKKQVGTSWPKDRLTLGGIVEAKITKLNENGRTCTVSISPVEISKKALSTAPNITTLLPGTLVEGLITATPHSGLNVKFLGFFEGTVDIFHMLPSTLHSYQLGEKVRGRILWTLPPLNDAPMRFALSLLPHIVSLEPKTAPLDPAAPNSERAQLNQILPVGTFVENFKIVKVEPEWGILAIIPNTDLKVFVHISNVSDEHLTSLSGNTKYKVGNEGFRGRVIGCSAFDGLLQLSLKESVLKRAFMKVSDLKVGQVLEGTVQRLSESALFVNIHGNVNGIVWPLHYSDLRLKHPERKFKVGGVVKARVIGLDVEKNRIVLTLKRSLVNSELPVLSEGIKDAEVGMILHATVHSFIKKDMLVEFIGGIKAFVPVSEAADKFVENIAKEFNIGQTIKVKLIKVDLESKRLTASVKQALDNYDASASTKDGQTKEKKQQKKRTEAVVADVSGIELGETISGTITDIHEQQVVLALSKDRIKALLSLTSLAKRRSTAPADLKTSLKVGEELTDLTVVSKNVEKGLVIVGYTASTNTKPSLVPTRSGISSNTHEALLTFDQLSEGQTLEGTISNDLGPQGYFVQLSKGMRGKLRATELADNYDDIPTLGLKKGSTVTCIITEFDSESKRIELSMRKSRLHGEDDASVEIRDTIYDDIDELSEGERLRGFVKSISDAGVFVEIGKDLTARVQIKELFDEYVKDWKPKFSVGQLVEGKILSTNPTKKQIEMSFRKSDAVKRTKKADEPVITFEGLTEGQVVRGVVKRIESYGAFIRIKGSTVSGLCHKSQFSDDSKADWIKLVSIGDEVRAMITSLDVEKRKIGFTMKPSKMPEQDESEGEEEAEAEERRRLVDEQTTDPEISDAESWADEADDGDDDDEEDLQILMGDEDDEDVEEDGDEDEEMADISEDAQSAPVASTSKAPLTLSAFKWDGQVEEDDGMEVDGDEGASDAESEESDAEASKKRTGRNQNILVDDKTGDLATKTPSSPSDFDRLLLGSPNSSFIWIQYMSYYLQLSDIEQARSIAERALRTINYREEEEKLNVWIALINLENSYGSDESLEKTFNKAVQANDAKQVYLRTLAVYEQTEKFDREEQLFEKFVKKFNMSSKAWTLYGQFLLNRGRSTEARDFLPRSLKSLPKRKHVKTITQFALMEFKQGEPERGRTIFEGVVDSYPKRLDLWWIYIDQEIRLRNIVGVRALFERVLAQKLSSKKTKSLLKKWLAFEKQHGDDAGAEAVKQKAIEYVSAMQS